MFLRAIAWTNFDANGNCIFNGNIGMWPFAWQVPAQCCLVICKAGNLEWKCYNVNKATYKEIWECAAGNCWEMARQMLWSSSPHYNTTLHFPNNDPDFKAAIKDLDLDICIYFQPPNSPDTNVLDLGFFRAIQSIQYQMNPKNILEFVVNHMKEAWSLQSLMMCSFPFRRASMRY